MSKDTLGQHWKMGGNSVSWLAVSLPRGIRALSPKPREQPSHCDTLAGTQFFFFLLHCSGTKRVSIFHGQEAQSISGVPGSKFRVNAQRQQNFLFKTKFVYLAALGLCCNAWYLHHVKQDLLLHCTTDSPPFVASNAPKHGVSSSSTRAQELWHVGLVASAACGTLDPRPRIEPGASCNRNMES